MKNFIQDTKNKKGLSTIVATMMLVLLGIIATGVLWIAVSYMFNENITLSPQRCLDNAVSPSLVIQKACYNSTSSDLILTLSRKNQLEITSIDFAIKTDKDSQAYTCTNSCGNCKILSSGIKDYYFSLDKKPDEVSLLVNGGCFLEKMVVMDC